MKLKDFKQQLLQDPDFKKEYEKYDLALEIGEMLVQARIIKGITQEKLAQMIKTKQSGIARAERGITLPSLSFLNKIALALKTTLIVRLGFMDKNNIKISEKNSTLQQTQTEPSIPSRYGTPTFAFAFAYPRSNSATERSYQ